jgi:hypothetical protein
LPRDAGAKVVLSIDFEEIGEIHMSEVPAHETFEEPKEEFFENEATDLEVEEVGDARTSAKPWDPSRIRISTKPFSLRQVTDMIRDGCGSFATGSSGTISIT